jgi:hypothetical protein
MCARCGRRPQWIEKNIWYMHYVAFVSILSAANSMLAAAIGSVLFVYILWPTTPPQSSREWIITTMPDDSIQLMVRHRPWAERLYFSQTSLTLLAFIGLSWSLLFVCLTQITKMDSMSRLCITVYLAMQTTGCLFVLINTKPGCAATPPTPSARGDGARGSGGCRRSTGARGRG